MQKTVNVKAQVYLIGDRKTIENKPKQKFII